MEEMEMAIKIAFMDMWKELQVLQKIEAQLVL